MVEAAAMFGHEAELTTRLLQAFATEPSITQLASDFPISAERNRLTFALDAYETCRREARIAFWRILLAEGCSIGEIGRIFGLSRQLVSRQLRDDASAQPDA
jgi:hypothetical protein